MMQLTAERDDVYGRRGCVKRGNGVRSHPVGVQPRGMPSRTSRTRRSTSPGTMLQLVEVALRATEYVTLRGGVDVPLRALQLAWKLEARGLQIGIDGEALTVGPKNRLTESDHRQIRAWRDELKAIAVYCSEVVA